MRFELNFKSGKPVYLQVVDQVKSAVASGAAKAGDPLPSIRPLAEVLRENLQSYLRAESEGHDAIMLGLAEHEADLRALQARLEAAMDEPVPGGDPLARFSIGALRHQAKVKLTR